MTISGVRGGAGVPDIPPDERTGPTSQTDEDFFRKKSAIEEVITFSRQTRAQKMSEEVKIRIVSLEKDFYQLNKHSLDYATLIDEERELPIEEEIGVKSQEIDEKMDELRGKMEVEISRLVHSYPDLHIKNKNVFADWWLLRNTEKKLRSMAVNFMKEQVINRCVNRIIFLEEVRNNLEKHKKTIVDNFCKKSSINLDLAEVSFQIEPQNSETHNKGKVPLKVAVLSQGVVLCHIFYKPRDARIDSAVVELFDRINHLPTEPIDLKSKNIDLPVYKIINVESDQEIFSIWEFIEGPQGQGEEARSVSQIIESMSQRQLLYEKISRLEQVCSYLNISDLHPENIIFKNLGTQNPEIVPVDLENFQEGNITGLFDRNPPSFPLSDAEKDLLNNFKATISSYHTRLVPIATSIFLGGMTKCDSFIEIAEAINDTFKHLKYCTIQPKEVLERWILHDFINNDVPYLVEYQDNVYYGIPSEGKILGEKNNV